MIDMSQPAKNRRKNDDLTTATITDTAIPYKFLARLQLRTLLLGDSRTSGYDASGHAALLRVRHEHFPETPRHRRSLVQRHSVLAAGLGNPRPFHERAEEVLRNLEIFVNELGSRRLLHQLLGRSCGD